MKYKINDLVKVQETGELGHIVTIDEKTGQPETIRDIKTGKLINVLDKTLSILRVFAWLVKQLSRLF